VSKLRKRAKPCALYRTDAAWEHSSGSRRPTSTARGSLITRARSSAKRWPCMIRSKLLLRGLNPQQRARLFVGQQIQQPVRTLANITDALMQIHQQRFASLFAFFVKHNALEMAGAADAPHSHRSDKEIVLPCGKPVARVKGQP